MTKKETLETIRKSCVRCVKSGLKFRYYYEKYNIPASKRAFLVGSADYENIGDLAISEAILAFMHTYFPEYQVIDIPLRELFAGWPGLRAAIRPSDIVLLQGGGNLGNLYPMTESRRREAIRFLRKNKCILFPQTIRFTKDRQGKRAFFDTVRIYSAHPRLLLFARDRKTEKIMQKFFTNPCERFPDIVLSSPYCKGPAGSAPDRRGILLCLRNDGEARLTDEARGKITELAGRYDTCMLIDNRTEQTDIFPNRKAIVNGQLNRFAGARLVITDRLHGMIFSAITGTPCIVLDNNYHKVRAGYHSIRQLPYIRLAENTEEISEHLEFLLHLPPQSFGSFLKGEFDQMAERMDL